MNAIEPLVRPQPISDSDFRKIRDWFYHRAGIHLSDQCRIDSNIANPTSVDGGSEANDVADDSAADREHDPLTVQTSLFSQSTYMVN